MTSRPPQVSDDLYTRFVSRLLFPLHERLKRHDTVALLRGLERTQWLPPQELLALQSLRLQTLISHASQRVPYYRALFRSRGIDPASIREAADLAGLPLLDKAAIRTAGDDLRASDAGTLEKASTSGSTGDPLKFWIGRQRAAHDVAAKWRATRWWGVDIGDPELVIWASPIEASAQDWVRALRDRLLRSRFMNAKDLSFPALERMIDEIEAMNPRMLFGYTAAFTRLARFARNRGRRIHAPALRVVFVTTERLDPDDRALIGEVFGAPAANGYGGRDSGFIAHDCPQGGMHLTAEDVIVEIIDEQGRVLGAGQAGEVVVTHLASGDFPFIRYRTGDIAELDNHLCSCGRGLPLLRDIHGRANDYLVGNSGRVAHYTALSHLLKDLPGLHTFKAIQESPDLIRLMVVLEQPIPDVAAHRIRAGLAQHLGDGVALRFERVDAIPLDATGKHKHIICRVPRPESPAAA
jgi:phenylacetate-CoA ligase